ncbi:hypothetical protein QOZ80_2BG0173260 [Eleusine coracana subsp. coracana]|nr:hypothetical protein QOZ80_2BG0173260 [Eleusine coracana subsp. coracana]
MVSSSRRSPGQALGEAEEFRWMEEEGGAMDEDEIEDQRLDSEEDEEGEVVVRDLDAEGIQTQTASVVIARFHTKHNFSPRGLFEAMQRAWGLRANIEYKWLQNNRFLIEFEGDGDYEFVLRGGPWIYRGDALVVGRYEGNVSPLEQPLDSVPIWVRFYDKPLNMMTETMGKNLGARIGKVRMVDVDNKRRAWADYMRVRVEVPVDKALTKWIRIQDAKSGNLLKFNIKYERVPHFCFYCGLIGHAKRDCDMPTKDRRVRCARNLNFESVSGDKRKTASARGTGRSPRKEKEADNLADDLGQMNVKATVNTGEPGVVRNAQTQQENATAEKEGNMAAAPPPPPGYKGRRENTGTSGYCTRDIYGGSDPGASAGDPRTWACDLDTWTRRATGCRIGCTCRTT